MASKVVVIGGTGTLGRPVAEGLSAAGWDVRVTSRDPPRARGLLSEDIEVVFADVDDRKSIEAALDGAFGVHISFAPGPDSDLERRGVQAVALVAAKSGLSRIGLFSGASTNEANAWFPFTRSKLEAERAVQECGVPWTIFRPTWVMDTLPNFARGKKALVFGEQPERIRFVAACDVARIVVAAWKRPEAENRGFYLYGPAPMTFAEALHVYCAIVRPGMTVQHVPFWVMRVMATLRRQELLKRFVIPFMRYCERVELEPGDGEPADTLFGPATTTLEAWCREQVAEDVAELAAAG